MVPGDEQQALMTMPTDFMLAREGMGTKTAPAPVRGRVVCPADTIDLPYSEGERRRDVRIRLKEVSWLLGARILYGDQVPVLNISSNGILIETGCEFPDSARIPIELFGKKGALALVGQVIRSRRFFQGDVVWYETACRFKPSVDLTDIVPRFLSRSATA